MAPPPRFFLRFAPGTIIETDAPLTRVSALLQGIFSCHVGPCTHENPLPMPRDSWSQVAAWKDVLECLELLHHRVEGLGSTPMPLPLSKDKVERMLPVMEQWQIDLGYTGLWKKCKDYLKDEAAKASKVKALEFEAAAREDWQEREAREMELKVLGSVAAIGGLGTAIAAAATGSSVTVEGGSAVSWMGIGAATGASTMAAKSAVATATTTIVTTAEMQGWWGLLGFTTTNTTATTTITAGPLVILGAFGLGAGLTGLAGFACYTCAKRFIEHHNRRRDRANRNRVAGQSSTDTTRIRAGQSSTDSTRRATRWGDLNLERRLIE